MLINWLLIKIKCIHYHCHANMDASKFRDICENFNKKKFGEFWRNFLNLMKSIVVTQQLKSIVKFESFTKKQVLWLAVIHFVAYIQPIVWIQNDRFSQKYSTRCKIRHFKEKPIEILYLRLKIPRCIISLP